MHYVYVLRSVEDEKFYIGYTSDLARRIEEHKRGGVHTTSRLSDPKLIFYESFISERDALRREKYFKTTKGKKALKLILRDSIKIT
ncbi:MAG: hypothetical protein A3K83_08000 [Omnitrophica WOR_2 bacterium RBG_13_44_8b]|nr:MAG: hypothetical protein A3K83_08000 [Omnitrophica WOR_2 bacterium RBG_13_44_8b]